MKWHFWRRGWRRLASCQSESYDFFIIFANCPIARGRSSISFLKTYNELSFHISSNFKETRIEMYENVHHMFPTKRHTLNIYLLVESGKILFSWKKACFCQCHICAWPFLKKIGTIHILIPRVQNVGSFPKIKNFSNDIHKFIISALLLMHASPCIAIFVRIIHKKCERIERLFYRKQIQFGNSRLCTYKC